MLLKMHLDHFSGSGGFLKNGVDFFKKVAAVFQKVDPLLENLAAPLLVVFSVALR